MVNENGEKWKELRNQLTPPLTKAPQNHAPQICQIIDDFIDVLETQAIQFNRQIHGFKHQVDWMFFFQKTLRWKLKTIFLPLDLQGDPWNGMYSVTWPTPRIYGPRNKDGCGKHYGIFKRLPDCIVRSDLWSPMVCVNGNDISIKSEQISYQFLLHRWQYLPKNFSSVFTHMVKYKDNLLDR